MAITVATNTAPGATTINAPTTVQVQSVLSKRLEEIPALRQLIQLGILAAAIGLGLWLFFWTQKPSQVALFSGLGDAEAADVTEALTQAGIPYTIDNATGAVMVEEAQVREARMKLVAQGLPESGRQGMEMIEGEQGFGVSQFVEGARYQVALETELARTIATLRPVRDARVHLALPKPSAFTRGREQAGASVLLDLRAGSTLDTNQVAAIVNLVSNSVPNLAPERVTVLDQSGRMLTVADPDSDDAISNRQFEQVRRLENSYAERITRLLEPLTGAGRVNSQVAVDMDFAVVEEARETFAPDPAKVRSEQVAEQSSTNKTDGNVPGATPNTPDSPDAAAAAAGDGSSSASRSATRNFEMDRTLTHTRTSPGRVARVTAAVLVDHIPGPAAEDGTRPMRALTAEELARVEALVKEAVGFSAERGDSVSVMNAPFAAPDPLPPAVEPTLWETVQTWAGNPSVQYWGRVLGGIALVLIVLSTVVRPAMQKVLSPAEVRAAEAEEDVLPPEDEERVSLTQDAQIAAAAQLAAPMPPAQEAQGILAGPQDYEQRLAVARAAVAQDPRRVAQVVRGWVGENG